MRRWRSRCHVLVGSQNWSSGFGRLANFQPPMTVLATGQICFPKHQFSTSNIQYQHEVDDFDFKDESCEIDESAILGGDNEKLITLKMILAEIELLRQQGSSLVPKSLKKIPKDKWKTLLQINSYSARRKYYMFLYENERKKEVQKEMKLKKKIHSNKILEEWGKKKELVTAKTITTATGLPYGLGFNCMFHRIYTKQIHRFFDYKLAMAQILGPHLIIDCSYEKCMNPKEINHCYTQLFTSWVENRCSTTPYDIIFCNLAQDSHVLSKMEKVVPHLHKPYSLFNYTEKSYIDLFPADKLIYLSPHSNYEMEDYDGDSIYIIGAFVDEIIHNPMSMLKAQNDGLRTAKFPIDKHCNWTHGSKLLPMNQCVSIIRDVKDGVSWKTALSHIAVRKVTNLNIHVPKECEEDTLSNKHIYAFARRQLQSTRRMETERNKRRERILQAQVMNEESPEKEVLEK